MESSYSLPFERRRKVAASGGEYQATVNGERDVTAGKNCNLRRLWLES